MILRREGNSYLVDFEFKDGLLGSEESMLRGPPGLVAHENSGVAGLLATGGVDENSGVACLSAAGVVEERRAVASSTTELPSCEAVESHELTHVLLEGAEKLHLVATVVVRKSQ